MCRVFKFEVIESPEPLKVLLTQEKNARKRERLQCGYGYKTGQAQPRQALGKLLNRSQVAIGQWIDSYRNRGVNGFLPLKYRGGNVAPSLPVEIQGPLKETLAPPEGVASYQASQAWLKETPGGEVPYSTGFGTVKDRLGARLKGPRPSAVDYAPDVVEEFKKNGASQPK